MRFNVAKHVSRKSDISHLMRVTYHMVTSTISCGQGGHYAEGE
jgi:hypothetical protein